MNHSKQPSFRKIRQAEKCAQRKEDAASIQKGADPVDIQNQNSIFKENIFSDAPIKRNGQIVAI